MRLLECYAAVLIVLLPTRWFLPAAGKWHAWLWALPMTLLGALRLIVYRPIRFRWNAGVIVVGVRTMIPGWAVGQTIGMITCYGPSDTPVTVQLERHERRHTWQFGVFGPTMLLLYPLASLWSILRGGNWYRGNAFEDDARAHEGDAS